jgi:ATP-dependent helicase/nuclease subunit A
VCSSDLTAVDERAPERRRREARWIAAWIQNHTGPGRPHRFGDVAILVRKTGSLGPFLDALKEAGLPYVVESDRSFYSAPEVVDVLNLLRVLENPDDGISGVGLLRSPLGMLSDREIYELRRDGRLDYRRGGEGPRLAPLFDLLRRFHARVDREPLGEFIGALLRESFLLEQSATAYYGEQTVSNLLKFGRLAREASESSGHSLRQFIDRTSRSIRDAVEEGESPLADERVDAVRLLTIHKAKGLEFPVVFAVDLSADAGAGRNVRPVLNREWSGGRAGVRLPRSGAADVASVLIGEREEEREEQERVRLFYVACTRARERLFLSGVEGGKESSFAGLCRRGGFTPASAAVAGVSSERLETVVLAAAPSTGKDASIEETHLRAIADRWDVRRREAARCASTAIFRSPSAEHPSDVPPREAFAPPPRSEDPATGGVVLGELCHRVLERWDFKDGGDVGRAVDDAWKVQARFGEPPDGGLLRKEACDLLATFFASPTGRSLAGGRVLAREAPFLFSTDEGIRRGTVDLLFRDERGLWVVDYKTDRVSASEAAERARRYTAQGSAYTAAIRAAFGEPCGFRVIFLRPAVAVDVLSCSDSKAR